MAASFFGTQRLGIHRALIFVDSAPLPTTAREHPAPRKETGRPAPVAHHLLPRPQAGVLWSGVAGIRTPDLRRARAALSRLSYDPVKRAGGRTWTRTRDLGLIRAAL